MSLKSVTLVAIGLALLFTAPIKANPITSSEFVVEETAANANSGYYTVINHSTDEYIWAFSVTNPSASTVGDSTTEAGWIAGKSPLFGGPKTGFYYATLPGFLEFRHFHLEFDVNPETIGPGESSSNFFFGTDLLFSSGTLFLVDAEGRFSTLAVDVIHGTNNVAPAVPEPSTWAMMILRFCGLGLLAYRRRNHLALAE